MKAPAESEKNFFLISPEDFIPLLKKPKPKKTKIDNRKVNAISEGIDSKIKLSLIKSVPTGGISKVIAAEGAMNKNTSNRIPKIKYTIIMINFRFGIINSAPMNIAGTTAPGNHTQLSNPIKIMGLAIFAFVTNTVMKSNVSPTYTNPAQKYTKPSMNNKRDFFLIAL